VVVFPVGSGYSYDGNAAITAFGKQHIYYRALSAFLLIPPQVNMHAETGGSIYLQHRAAIFCDWRFQIWRHDINTQISRPIIRAMRSVIKIFTGCISSVTSVDVPPVDNLQLALTAPTHLSQELFEGITLFIQHFLCKLVDGYLC
jgi:hypothetical protein